jgi:hypothetical protein
VMRTSRRPARRSASSYAGTVLLIAQLTAWHFPETEAQSADCVGAWSDCDSSCADKTFSITTPAAGEGASCEVAHGSTRQCLQGDGGCATQVDERLCVRPSSAAGYDFSSASETLAGGSFAATGITCSSGYAGTASATVCSADGGEYSVSGCTEFTCVRPSSAAGYDFSSVSETLAGGSFAATGI